MTSPECNPRLTPLLRAFTFVEVVVLLAAGFGMLFLPDLGRALWPWTPAPFNTRFLGAIYAAALMPVGVMALVGRWAPARVVLVMLVPFTLIVLGVSLFNLGQFQLERWSNWVWFPLYVLLPLNGMLHVWRYRNLPPAEPTRVLGAWRAYLRAGAIVVGIYGLALLIAPTTASAFWPWPIDAFHGQMYSAAFISGALGAFAVSTVAARGEFLAIGLGQAVFGVFSIAGLLLANGVVPPERQVNWASAGAWVWVGAFALMAVAGTGMVLHSRSMPHSP